MAKKISEFPAAGTLDGTELVPVVKTLAGVPTTTQTTVQAIEDITEAQTLVTLAASSGSSLVGFVQSGTGAVAQTVQNVLRRTVAAEDFSSIQIALNSGAKIVELTAPSYNIATSLSIPAGVKLRGKGKANTAITLTANISPFVMTSVNDATVDSVLVIAHATQTAPIYLLDAESATMTRCGGKDVQVSGNTTDFPLVSIRTRNGAYGSWAHTFNDISGSGTGTIFKAETQSANSWINSVSFSNIHANDFIRGMQLIETLGDGCSDSEFINWACQTSARTQFGALVSDVTAQGKNRKNSFHDVRFYDLPAGARSYYIGDNVLDTIISGIVVDDANPTRIFDKGVNTLVNGGSLFDYMARNGRKVLIPTEAGLTAATSGTATTGINTSYAFVRSGATLGSVARLYSTDIICGLSQNQIFNTNFGLPLKFSFIVSRITTGTSALARIQFKTTQNDGQLTNDGIGIQIDNYTITAESFGSALGTVSTGIIMVDAEAYKIDIIHFPGERTEWWINGVLTAQQTDVTKIPSIISTCYLQTSIANIAANDVQMFISSISADAGI